MLRLGKQNIMRHHLASHLQPNLLHTLHTVFEYHTSSQRSNPLLLLLQLPNQGIARHIALLEVLNTVQRTTSFSITDNCSHKDRNYFKYKKAHPRRSPSWGNREYSPSALSFNVACPVSFSLPQTPPTLFMVICLKGSIYRSLSVRRGPKNR